eukprot:gene4835-5300_t
MVESREPQLLRDDELDTSSCGNKPSSTLPTDPQQNEKEEVVISKDEKRRLTRRVLAMVGQYPGYATLGLLGALFFGAIFPCWGYMLSKTQTSLFLSDPDEIEDRARFYAFLYIMLAGVSFLSSLAMYYGVVAAGEHVAMEMRSALFESFFHHPVAFFDQPQHSVGTLTAQLAGETRFVSKALGEGFARQLQALSTLLVALGLGFSSSWQIAFIVIACFPLTIAAGAVRMKAMRGMQYDHEDDEQKVASENDKQNARKREKGSKQDPNNSIPHSQKSDEDSKQDLAASGANQGSIMAGYHSLSTTCHFVLLSCGVVHLHVSLLHDFLLEVVQVLLGLFDKSDHDILCTQSGTSVHVDSANLSACFQTITCQHYLLLACNRPNR